MRPAGIRLWRFGRDRITWRMTVSLLATKHYLDGLIDAVDGELLADDGGPFVRVRLDRWIFELIGEYTDLGRPSEIRAFVREAVIRHLGIR